MQLNKSLIENHPTWPAVQSICTKLHEKGFQSWLAGGCVRDAFLGVSPRDIDIATSAHPDQVQNLFKKTVDVGKSFGVIRVVFDQVEIEVASFRKDGLYVDGRRPESIDFASPQEDAQRRDFTVNALFYDPIHEIVHDFVGGLVDLQNRILRAVGEPRKRFQEDHLRILRGLRFVSQLGFKLEHETSVAMESLAPLLKTVAKERIAQELIKFAAGSFSQLAINELNRMKILEILWPQLSWVVGPFDKIIWRSVGTTELHCLLKWSHALFESEKLKIWLDDLRLSNELKSGVLAIQRIVQEHRAGKVFDIGEAVIWQSEVFWYELSWYLISVQLITQEQLKLWESRYLELGRKLPEKWVTASDLSGRFSGPLLGLVLRECYLEQLRGSFVNKAELLLSLNEQKVLSWKSRSDRA